MSNRHLTGPARLPAAALTLALALTPAGVQGAPRKWQVHNTPSFRVMHFSASLARKVGAAADLAIFRLDRVDFAGAMHDPAAAILFCGAGVRADYTIVAGRVLVERGELVGIDEQELFHRANAVAARMVRES